MKIQRELTVSEQMYRMLFEDSIEAIGISRGNKIVSANNALLDLLGYEAIQELMQVPLLDCVAPKSRNAVKERTEKRTREEIVPSCFNHKLICKNGDIIEVEMLSSELWLENEKYILFTFRDITAVRLGEDSLRESEENFRDLAANANDAILIFLDKEGLTYVNDRACKLLGYTREELLTAGENELRGVDEVYEITTSQKNRVEENDTSRTNETALHRKNGERVPI